MSNHGTFSGNPMTEWVVDASGRDRDMKLLEDFSFTDPNGRVWPAPQGDLINGASIPRPLWTLVGSPYTDDYRRASVVHDIACRDPAVPRKEADVMFYHACRVGGCAWRQACILYAGVRIGAWADRNLPAQNLSDDLLETRVPLDASTADERFLRGKLADIAQGMAKLQEESSIDEMDALIAEHLQF